MKIPHDFKPVLAKISHQNSLGRSEWFEVVYYDNDIAHGWKAYADSDTFKDGEKVERWEYADALPLMNC